MTDPVSLSRRLVAEFVGTAMLLAIVVGSGVMANRLAGGNVAIALLANTLATGAGLVALILTFGPLSGAHFNPVVTCTAAMGGSPLWREVPAYLLVQILGAIVGVLAAHGMFALPAVTWSHHERSGVSQVFSEGIATFGLMAVIHGCGRYRPAATPFAVAAYITSAYWFTASTSFANPAVTIARSMSDTFAGIRPVDVPWFIVAQTVGAIVAGCLFKWLLAPVPAAGRPEPVQHPTHLPGPVARDTPQPAALHPSHTNTS
jgi:glycerol uptake facilitator-like aquaporin